MRSDLEFHSYLPPPPPAQIVFSEGCQAHFPDLLLSIQWLSFPSVTFLVDCPQDFHVLSEFVRWRSSWLLEICSLSKTCKWNRKSNFLISTHIERSNLWCSEHKFIVFRFCQLVHRKHCVKACCYFYWIVIEAAQSGGKFCIFFVLAQFVNSAK